MNLSVHYIVEVRCIAWEMSASVGLCYVLESTSFRPDIQKPRQLENAVRDI